MGKTKKDKLKIPKEIAGVKIPKELRKKAKLALAVAESPMARELLAAGLTAAAAVLAKGAEEDKAAPAKTEEGADRPDDHKEAERPRKRNGFAGIAKDIAVGVAAAYAEEALTKAGKPKKPAPKPENATH